MTTKTYKAPKHRNIIHLHAKMKGGAGGHKVAQSPRRVGPQAEEFVEVDDTVEPMFFDVDTNPAE